MSSTLQKKRRKMMRPNNTRVVKGMNSFTNDWSLLGDHRQSADDRKTEVKSLGITTCHFNSIRHEWLVGR